MSFQNLERYTATFRGFALAIAMFTVICCTGIPAYAQVFSGSVSGTITDSSGAAVPGADLTLTQASTRLVVKTSSDANGLFVFPTVDAGDYNLTIAKDGFSNLEKT